MDVWVHKYISTKEEILGSLAYCHPAIAKLGAGRAAIFPLVSHKWEAEDYALKTVAYARRAMFYANPTQLYIFCMFNWHCDKQSEFSTDDKIWANEIKREKGDSRGALDAFLPTNFDKGEAERIINIMATEKPKKLAIANMGGVMASIKQEVTNEGSSFLDNPQDMQYLTEIGWADWFQKHVMGPHQAGAFNCVGTLDEPTKRLLGSTSKRDVKDFLDLLARELRT